MSDKIELLSESLIDDNKDLALDVLGYLSKFGCGLGWHYLLDLIWILRELELPVGSTILDAGAGTGVLQYILALRGYNVISADVNKRNSPPFLEKIINVRMVSTGAELDHPFLEWHGLNQSGDVTTEKIEGADPQLPEIAFYHADLKDLSLLEDNCIDAVVSLSALEHNDLDSLEQILKELNRVLVPNGSMHITVSAAEKSFFHESSHSWILDEEDIIKHYELVKIAESNFSEFKSIFAGIKSSERLSSWLSYAYYRSDKNGMPWGKWNPAYQPVGISKITHK